jgi:hypothetical protein
LAFHLRLLFLMQAFSGRTELRQGRKAPAFRASRMNTVCVTSSAKSGLRTWRKAAEYTKPIRRSTSVSNAASEPLLAYCRSNPMSSIDSIYYLMSSGAKNRT